MKLDDLRKRVSAASPAEIAFAVVIGLILVTGTAFRLAAVTTPFWTDEARQADALSGGFGFSALGEWPLHLRPVLYVLISKALAAIHNVEWVLRLPSLLPSIASLFVTLALARLLFSSRTAVLLCLFLVAFNPWLIDFAREYKPYALEHFLITLQGFLTFRWLLRSSRRSLFAFLVIAAISPLLGFACVFVEPFLFAVIIVHAWRNDDKRVAVIAATAAAVSAALFLAQYYLFQHSATRVGFRYWRRNFYDTGFRWKLLHGHTTDIIGRFAAPKVFWTQSTWLAGALFRINLALFAIGLYGLAVGRRWALVAVTLGGLLLPLLVSFTGRWPYGMVRVNLYMIILVVLVWGAAFELAAGIARLKYVGVGLVALLVVLYLPIHPGFFMRKWIPAAHMHPKLKMIDMPDLLAKIYSADQPRLARGDKICVHVAATARAALSYYTRHHANAASHARKLAIGRRLSYNSRFTGIEMRSAMREQTQPCWLIVSYKFGERLAFQRAVETKAFRVLRSVHAPGLEAHKLQRVAPKLVERHDDRIVLKADHATLHGHGLWFYGRPRIGDVRTNDRRWSPHAIGNWTNAGDWISWEFELRQAKTYLIELHFAAGADAKGNDYVATLDRHHFPGRVAPTGGWRKFRSKQLGKIALAPGRHTISLAVTNKRTDYVMNVRSFILHPIE